PVVSTCFSCAISMLLARSSVPRSAPCGSGLVFADQQLVVGKIGVGRHVEVHRRRLVLEDPPGEVEGRAMARAEEAALPVVGKRRLGAGRETLGGRAAEVRADADQHEQVLANGAPLVLGVLGRGDLVVALRGGVGELVVQALERGDHVVAALDDPDRLALPFDPLEIARLHAGDVDLDRGAGGLGALGGREAGHEGHGGSDATHRAEGGGNADDATARLVYRLDRSRFRRLARYSRARGGGQFVRIAHGFASLKFKPVTRKTLDFNILQRAPRSPRATSAPRDGSDTPSMLVWRGDRTAREWPARGFSAIRTARTKLRR